MDVRLATVVAAGLAFAAAGCGSTSTTSTRPSDVRCEVSASPDATSVSASGGSVTITLTTERECTWDASVDAPWITQVAPASGQGSAELRVQVAANPGAARNTTITVGSEQIQIAQASGCTFTVDPKTVTVGAGAGSAEVKVAADSTCAWTAASQASWITVTSGASSSGTGAVRFSVAANQGPDRNGTITVAGQSVTVTQTSGCTYTIEPTSQAFGTGGGTGTVRVSTSGSCPWTAASNANWVVITSGASGTGAGTIGFRVEANSGTPRQGAITVGGRTFTVTQAGCSYTIAPASQSFGAGGGKGSFTVSTAPSCPWTATSTAPWIAISPGTGSGSGNGTVAFTVQANTSPARNGTITVAGQTFTVSQASGCSPAVTPLSLSVPAAGGPRSVAVSAGAGCTWSVSGTPPPWITNIAPNSGSGNGTVTFTVAANAGPMRSGTLSVAGQTVTITQASGCTFTISPTTASFGVLGGAGSVTVTAPAGCTWSATVNPGAPWLSIISGSNGSGNGSVVFTVTPNLGRRSGSMTIAGHTFTVTQN